MSNQEIPLPAGLRAQMAESVGQIELPVTKADRLMFWVEDSQARRWVVVMVPVPGPYADSPTNGRQDGR